MHMRVNSAFRKYLPQLLRNNAKHLLLFLQSGTANLLLIGLNLMVLTSSLFILCTTGTYVISAVRYVDRFRKCVHILFTHFQSDCLCETVYQLNWYDYSIREQKMLLLFMLRLQTPSSIQAYNYFICSHVTFQKV